MTDKMAMDKMTMDQMIMNQTRMDKMMMDKMTMDMMTTISLITQPFHCHLKTLDNFHCNLLAFCQSIKQFTLVLQPMLMMLTMTMALLMMMTVNDKN